MTSFRSISALLLLLLLGSCTQASSFQYSGDPYQSQTFSLSGAGQIQVETSGAAITVSGKSGKTVTIDMYVKHKGKEIETKTPEIEKLLENYELDFSQNGNKIILKAKQKGNINWSSDSRLQLAFEVSVPHEMSTTIASSGGSISLTELTGNQEINTSGGSVQVSQSEGKLSTRSSGGSIRLEEFRGNASIQTSGGSVKINKLTGDLDISSSGGSVTMEEINGSINASSSGGSIKAQLSHLEKSLNMRSSGGSVTAVIPDGLGLDLNLQGGRVSTSLSNFSGEQKKDKVVGTINGGGIPVTMQSSGGSINLEFSGKN